MNVLAKATSLELSQNATPNVIKHPFVTAPNKLAKFVFAFLVACCKVSVVVCFSIMEVREGGLGSHNHYYIYIYIGFRSSQPSHYSKSNSQTTMSLLTKQFVLCVLCWRWRCTFKVNKNYINYNWRKGLNSLSDIYKCSTLMDTPWYWTKCVIASNVHDYMKTA